MSSYLTYVDSYTTLGNEYNALIILPPTDTQLLVEVRGLFYSKQLTADTDTNYWSDLHPTLLLKAIALELEIFNQNASRIRTWQDAVAKDLVDVSKDLVEEVISEVDQIEN